MRRCYVFITCCVFALSLCQAQNFLKNGGFETWSGNLPVSWKTDTISSKKSVIARSGTSALKFGHSEFFGMPFLGSLFQDSLPVSGNTFSFKGWHQLYPDSGDHIIFLVIINGKQGGISGKLAGAGSMNLTTKKTIYTAFQFGISMVPNVIPETASVSIYSLPDTASGNYHRGTYALFDDFVLDNTITGVLDKEFMYPQSFSFEQNYPNPFNPNTIIEFSLPKEQHVVLRVFNTLGQVVATMLDENLPQGRYRKEFNGIGLSSGIYFYEIRAGEFSQVKKMMLVK